MLKRDYPPGVFGAICNVLHSRRHGASVKPQPFSYELMGNTYTVSIDEMNRNLIVRTEFDQGQIIQKERRVKNLVEERGNLKTARDNRWDVNDDRAEQYQKNKDLADARTRAIDVECEQLQLEIEGLNQVVREIISLEDALQFQNWRLMPIEPGSKEDPQVRLLKMQIERLDANQLNSSRVEVVERLATLSESVHRESQELVAKLEAPEEVTQVAEPSPEDSQPGTKGKKLAKARSRG